MTAIVPANAASAPHAVRVIETLLSFVGSRLYRCGLRRSGRLCIAVAAARPELHVLAMLRTARSVVELCPLIAAVDDRSKNVVRIHDRFDENQRVVRRAESVLQVPNGPDDERSGRGVATEYFRQVGIGPVRDV